MEVSGKEIAKRLGISTATVSLALNDRPGVSPQTKAVVLACREQMEKEAEREKKCGGFILVLGGKENRDLLPDLCACLNREGFLLSLKKEDRSYDGAIVLDEESLPEAGNLPAVLLNGEKAAENADVLQTDAYEAMQIAIRRLSEKGCRKILYLTGGETDFAARERLQAFSRITGRSEMETGQIDLSREKIGERAAAEERTGIIYASEHVCHMAAAAGWRGWAREEVCFGMQPVEGICTVGTPAEEVAQQACKLLVRRMDGMDRAGACYILKALVLEPNG